MRTAKQNISEKLNDRIEEMKQERAQNLAEFTREKETARAKIADLEIAKSNAETPAQYREVVAQIHEQEEYLNFLNERERAANETPLLSLAEFNAIKAEIVAENQKILDASAGDILKKFDELTALMNEYTRAANDLQKVLDRAEMAHFRRKLGGHLWHELRILRPDKYGIYNKMLLTYLNHRANELNR